MKATYIIVLDRETDGRVIASIPGVLGCHTYGRTTSEAVRRAKSALRFYIKELIRTGRKPPKQLKPVAVKITLAM